MQKCLCHNWFTDKKPCSVSLKSSSSKTIISSGRTRKAVMWGAEGTGFCSNSPNVSKAFFDGPSCCLLPRYLSPSPPQGVSLHQDMLLNPDTHHTCWEQQWCHAMCGECGAASCFCSYTRRKQATGLSLTERES